MSIKRKVRKSPIRVRAKMRHRKKPLASAIPAARPSMPPGRGWLFPLIRWSLIVIAAIGAFVVLPIAAGFMYFNWPSGKPSEAIIAADRAEAIERTIIWMDLKPFPVPAVNLIIKSKGIVGAREHDIRFKAPAAEVKHWIRHCPGLKGLKPKVLDDGSRIYRVEPHRGELHVSADGSVVTIKAFQH